VENSGWTHIKSDIVDWHHYVSDVATWASTVAAFTDGSEERIRVPLGSSEFKEIYADDTFPRTGVPIINSEYGTGHTSFDRGWQLRWQTQELRRHDRLAGYVYCEITDIEHEMAGVFTFERTGKELGSLEVASVNAETTIVFDLVPVEPGIDVDSDGSPFSVPVRISHHGRAALRAVIRSRWLPVGSPVAAADGVVAAEPAEVVEVEPFRLSAPRALRTQLPEGWSAGRLVVEALDGEQVAASGFLDVGRTEVRPWIGQSTQAEPS
jgi:hypothetical protein